MQTASPARDAPVTEPVAAPGHPSEERLFRDLVASHRKKLYAFVLRNIGNASDAEDLTQQAFIEAAKSLATFRGESALSTWLYGIATNLVRNHLSRAPQCRYRFDGEEALESVQSSAAGPQRRLEGAQVARLLLAELELLGPDMRDALLLVALDDLSYEAAAATLSIPIGTVRSRVSRARTTLRQRLAAAGVESPV